MNPVQISPNIKINNSQVEDSKLKKRSYTPIIVGLTLIFILLIMPTASLVAASYLSVNIPLVPKSLQREVDITIASIPWIPKTPKQILTRVFDNKNRIQTSKETFLLGIKGNGQDLGTLKINSQLDVKDLSKPSLSADILGEYAIGQQNLRLNLSLTEINKDCYFKVNEIPAIPSFDFSKIKGKWFAINLDNAGQSIGASSRSDSDIYSDMSGKMSELATIFDTDLARKIKELPAEKISGEDSFHLQVSPDSETMTKIFNTIYPESKFPENEVRNTFKEVKVDLWVTKNKFLIYKTEILTKLGDSTSSQSNMSASNELEVTFSYQLSEVNKNLKIEAPQGATKLKSFLDLASLIETRESNPGPVLGVSTQASSFGSDTLYYERLLHVLTLLPSVVK